MFLYFHGRVVGLGDAHKLQHGGSAGRTVPVAQVFNGLLVTDVGYAETSPVELSFVVYELFQLLLAGRRRTARSSFLFERLELFIVTGEIALHEQTELLDQKRRVASTLDRQLHESNAFKFFHPLILGVLLLLCQLLVAQGGSVQLLELAALDVHLARVLGHILGDLLQAVGDGHW